MNKKQLTSLVIKEAKALKKAATKKELSRLSFEKLNPENEQHCIYGQMTDSCYSDRASSLIGKCCEKGYIGGGVAYLPTLELGEIVTREFGRAWSPIEVFIAIQDNRTNGNNAMLISFLKGERKTLRFKSYNLTKYSIS